MKDFDISKEAGGVEIAISKRFNATVHENYLEIHLVWAGKGTCCTPVQGYYGPIISALSVVPGNTNISFSLFKLNICSFWSLLMVIEFSKQCFDQQLVDYHLILARKAGQG